MDERTRLINWLWEHNSELTDEQFAEGVRAMVKATAEYLSTHPDNRTREEKIEDITHTIATAPPEKVEFLLRIAGVISTMADAELSGQIISER